MICLHFEVMEASDLEFTIDLNLEVYATSEGQGTTYNVACLNIHFSSGRFIIQSCS